MKVKIKSRPEDFKVEEIIALVPEDKGAFGIYLLEKQGWNTVELLHVISRKFNLPFKDFSYAGMKDRYGLTKQYITIKGSPRIELKEKNYSLRFVSFSGRPMGPDLIKENKFEITVRNLNAATIKEALKRAQVVNKIGYPNYFDDQRFGSFDSRQGFFAEKIIKGHLNGALKIYFTSVRPEDKKGEKQRKTFIFDHWRDWKLCRKKAKSKFEEAAFDFLSGNPNAFAHLLRKIPKDELSLFVAAYQSYIWNEVLRRIVSSFQSSGGEAYKGVAGDYIFYEDAEKIDLGNLAGLTLPMPGAKAKMPDLLSEDIYSRVLEENSLTPKMFNKIKLRPLFFKSFDRQAVIKPREFSFQVLDDEVYKNKKKLCLKFSLPRGSYATMLVKRLFAFSGDTAQKL